MSNKNVLEGRLIFNEITERYELYSKGECLVEGFHCGDGLEVKINGVWIPTAFEIYDGWYLVGLKGITIDGRTARKRY